MSEVLYDSRWIGNHGIGRFAGELNKTIPDFLPFRSNRPPWHPLDPALLGAALARLKPKLFFSPGYNPPIGWRGRFVFTLHDLHHLCVRDNSNAAKRAYYQYIIKPACHRAAFLLTVSEYSKREICAWANLSEDRIVNVGNGVRLPFGPSGDKYDPGYPYLLYVGAHAPNKNLSRLLRAYAASGVCKDARLLMSGRPSRQMMEEIHHLGLSENVVFIGSRSDLELSNVYRGALGFVFPSLYEGFGLPPLEAMACGVPVLTSNLCSLPEIVGDAGILIDPRSVEEMADGMRRLTRDSALRSDLTKKGLDRASKFSWEKTARMTMDVLQAAGARD